MSLLFILGQSCLFSIYKSLWVSLSVHVYKCVCPCVSMCVSVPLCVVCIHVCSCVSVWLSVSQCMFLCLCGSICLCGSLFCHVKFSFSYQTIKVETWWSSICLSMCTWVNGPEGCSCLNSWTWRKSLTLFYILSYYSCSNTKDPHQNHSLHLYVPIWQCQAEGQVL